MSRRIIPPTQDEMFDIEQSRQAIERHPQHTVNIPQRLQNRLTEGIVIASRRPNARNMAYEARSQLGHHNKYTASGGTSRSDRRTSYQHSINNPALYAKAKRIADRTYKKPSAYKSGFIVKTYKDLGGTYRDTSNPKTLKRWFKEKWTDIGHKSYPVYRPTKRINKHTPLTASEIDPVQARKQIRLKQKIRGDANLPRFLKR